MNMNVKNLGEHIMVTSDTPRTERELYLIAGYSPHGIEFVRADFARTLERELAVANEAIRQLSKPAVTYYVNGVWATQEEYEAMFGDKKWR